MTMAGQKIPYRQMGESMPPCEPGNRVKTILDDLTWCESFVLLGLHCFWVLSKSSPLAMDNAWGATLALTPFLVAILLGVGALSNTLRGALIRLEAALHWTTAALQTALLTYIVWQDPFQPLMPLACPLALWSLGMSFLLAANMSVHLRRRDKEAGEGLTSPAWWGMARAVVCWGMVLWAASGATWTVYFWTASIVLHALLAPLTRRAVPSLLRGGPVRHGLLNQTVVWTEPFLLLTLVLIALLLAVRCNVYMGTLEAKYVLFLDLFRAPAFFAGAAFFLAAARWRFTLLAHVAAAALLFFAADGLFWPLAFGMGYALPALFQAIRRLNGFGYGLACLLISFIWFLGLTGFSFSGMIVHFGFGSTVLQSILQWGRLILVLTTAVWVFGTLYAARKERTNGEKAVPQFIALPAPTLCTVLFFAILLITVLPSVFLLASTTWPPHFATRPQQQPVEEPMALCHAGYSQSEDEYRLLDELGVQTFRADFPWSNAQPAPDTWNLGFNDAYVDNAAKHGKQVIAILDFDNNAVEQDAAGKTRGMYIAPADVPRFLEYADRMVRHYQGRVYAWEIWNEPNIARFWDGPMEEFYALARQTAETVRKADPAARIAGTAMTSPMGALIPPGIDGLHASGALAPVHHPSGHLYLTDPRQYSPEFMKLIGAARRFKHPGSVWVTELGAPDGGYYPWCAEGELSAQHVIKAYTTATSLGIDMVVWYCFHDGDLNSQSAVPHDSEGFFGLIGPGERWKPAAHAYQLFSRHCSHSTLRAGLLQCSGGLAARQMRSALYRRDNGESALILWFEPMLRPWGHARVRLNLGATAELPQVHDIASGYGKAFLDDHLEVSEKPVMITFKASEPGEPVRLEADSSPMDALWLLFLSAGLMGSFAACFQNTRHA